MSRIVLHCLLNSFLAFVFAFYFGGLLVECCQIKSGFGILYSLLSLIMWLYLGGYLFCAAFGGLN